MTKCYAIPGLRLGYMPGNPAIVEFGGLLRAALVCECAVIPHGKPGKKKKKKDVPARRGTECRKNGLLCQADSGSRSRLDKEAHFSGKPSLAMPERLF